MQISVYLYKDWIVLRKNQLNLTEESVDLMRVKSSPIQNHGQYDQEEACFRGNLCLHVGEHLLVETSFWQLPIAFVTTRCQSLNASKVWTFEITLPWNLLLGLLLVIITGYKSTKAKNSSKNLKQLYTKSLWQVSWVHLYLRLPIIF